MKVILIHGKSRSGKNTVSGILISNLSQAIEIGNADAVRRLAKEFYTWDEVKDDKGKKLLIDVTDAGYNYDPYFWEKKSLEQVTELVNAGVQIDYLLVPDWRYKSTYDYWCEMLGENGVLTIKVDRPNFDNGLSDIIKKDKSENMLNDFKFDHTIYNEGTINDLVPQVIAIMGLSLREE